MARPPKSRDWLKPFLSRYSPKALKSGIAVQKIVKDWKRPEDKNQKVMVKTAIVKGSNISLKTLSSYKTKSDLSKISQKNILALYSLYRRINYAHLKANGANTIQASKYRSLPLNKIDALISTYKECTTLAAKQKGIDHLAIIYGFNRSSKASIDAWNLWKKLGGSPISKKKTKKKKTHLKSTVKYYQKKKKRR